MHSYRFIKPTQASDVNFDVLNGSTFCHAMKTCGYAMQSMV